MLSLRGQMVRIWVVVNVAVALMSAELASARSETIRLIAFGDSLTAGYGLKAAEAFPVRLEAALKAKGYDVTVSNAGVSGDTTAGGLERIEWAVPEGSDAVILELGANDALRGLPVDRAKANLDAILTRLKERRIPVLLTGMRAPRNLGDDYANRFDAMFRELAEKHGTLFYPFFLTGIALDPKLNLADGMHPNPAGVDVIVERILPTVGELIGEVKERRTQASRG